MRIKIGTERFAWEAAMLSLTRTPTLANSFDVDEDTRTIYYRDNHDYTVVFAYTEDIHTKWNVFYKGAPFGKDSYKTVAYALSHIRATEKKKHRAAWDKDVYKPWMEKQCKQMVEYIHKHLPSAIVTRYNCNETGAHMWVSLTKRDDVIVTLCAPMKRGTLHRTSQERWPDVLKWYVSAVRCVCDTFDTLDVLKTFTAMAQCRTQEREDAFVR